MRNDAHGGGLIVIVVDDFLDECEQERAKRMRRQSRGGTLLMSGGLRIGLGWFSVELGRCRLRRARQSAYCCVLVLLEYCHHPRRKYRYHPLLCHLNLMLPAGLGWLL